MGCNTSSDAKTSPAEQEEQETNHKQSNESDSNGKSGQNVDKNDNDDTKQPVNGDDSRDINDKGICNFRFLFPDEITLFGPLM